MDKIYNEYLSKSMFYYYTEEDFKGKTLQSNLSERNEQHLGNKWQKKANIRRNLFKSQQNIKKSIITKEVLDQPLALRK